MEKLLIYTPKLSPRIQYIFDFILRDFSGLDFEFTTNYQFFEASDALTINYSYQPFADEIFVRADEFMFESGGLEPVSFEELNEIGKCFYALSRYEEYFPLQRDHHDRLSGKGTVYKTPFVDEWILTFQKQLSAKKPNLTFKKRKFEIILTCDIDQAWKYKHKGWKRTAGAFIRDLIKFEFNEFSIRNSVISGKTTDPFDTFDYFKERMDAKDVNTVLFFWLMADYAAFDKNNPVDNKAFQEKIREVSSWSDYGIHPSYASNREPQKLALEIKRLADVLDKPVVKSRQHYIKLKFPETYRHLISAGIKEDYSMAYADETGFRAGTCSSFFWYDLEKEEKTELEIHPFCAMDVSMRNYMKLSKEESIQELQRLKSSIQKVNGKMIVLFHNSNFNESWSGWKEVMDSLFE